MNVSLRLQLGTLVENIDRCFMDRFFYRLLYLIHRVSQWLSRHFTISGQVVLVSLVIAAIIGLDTHQSLSYQVFTFLLSLLTVAIASSFFTRYRFTATRHLPRFGTVKLPLHYRIVLQGWLPDRSMKNADEY